MTNTSKNTRPPIVPPTIGPIGGVAAGVGGALELGVGGSGETVFVLVELWVF